jgi:hypothetical protein
MILIYWPTYIKFASNVAHESEKSCTPTESNLTPNTNYQRDDEKQATLFNLIILIFRVHGSWLRNPAIVSSLKDIWRSKIIAARKLSLVDTSRYVATTTKNSQTHKNKQTKRFFNFFNFSNFNQIILTLNK